MAMKEILLEQFNSTYNDNGWFVALEKALDGISAEEALWKEGGIDHSVWELAEHLRYWNNRWLQRFLGGVVDEGKETIDATFRGAAGDSEEEWEKLKSELFRVFAEWKSRLESVDEALLGEQVSEQYEAPWAMPLAHQNIHNAYHIGQIVVIRKLRGNWNAKQGVS